MSEQDLSVIIHTDGGARGNPGPAGAGVVIVDAADGQAIFEGGLFLGRATNNVAEYKGVIAALKAAGMLGARRVTLQSDSQLLVRQINGQYRVKNAGLRPLYQQAVELAGQFDSCEFRHVRREENTVADRLVNRAIDAKKHVEGAADWAELTG
jgi:ribonuclease HI